MKKLVLLLLIATVTLAQADDSKLSPELRGYRSTKQVQVIVQYAPGTQVNCSGLLGLVGCLVNDVLKLGHAFGTVATHQCVVALLDGNVSKRSRITAMSCTSRMDRPLSRH